MEIVTLRDGARVPRVGQGTWMMGEDPAREAAEIAALRLGLDLGMTLIDTAELYASGGAERVVGRAIAGRRDEVFLVSKVLPTNASCAGTLEAAERSLRRLGTDRLDLYLLHWPGSHPLEETLRAFLRLRQEGKILRYGVSNFDVEDMEEVLGLPGGDEVLADQVLYNLVRRGPERRLFPRCAAAGVSIMAYSPVEQARLAVTPALEAVASRHGVSPYAAAVAWSARHPGTVTIPKAVRPEHVRENAAAGSVLLDEEDLAALDAAYPRPKGDLSLEWL